MRVYLLLLLCLCNFFIIMPCTHAGGSQTNFFDLTTSPVADERGPAYKRRIQVTRMSGGSIISFSSSAPSSPRSSGDLNADLQHIILFVDRQGFKKTPGALYWANAFSYDDSESFPQDNRLSTDSMVFDSPLHLTVLAPRGGKLSAAQKQEFHRTFPRLVHLDDMAGVIRRSWGSNFSPFSTLEKLSVVVPAHKIHRLGGLSQVWTLCLFIENPPWYRSKATLDLHSLSLMHKLEQLIISCTSPDTFGTKPAPYSKRIRRLHGLDALPSSVQETGGEESGHRACLFDLSGTYIDVGSLAAKYPHIHFINDVRQANEED